MVKCFGQFCFNICFLWFIYGWCFCFGSFSTTGGGSASRAHLYKHYVHLLFTTCSATATHKNVSNHYTILSYNINGMMSCTVATGRSHFPSKIMNLQRPCWHMQYVANVNHKEMHTITKRCFSTSYTIIYYTQKQATSDTNISNVPTPYFTPELCSLKYNDLPLLTFLCHLTVKLKHTQLYLTETQQACIVHNTTVKGIMLRHKNEITCYVIITMMCLYNTLTNCVSLVC